MSCVRAAVWVSWMVFGAPVLVIGAALVPRAMGQAGQLRAEETERRASELLESGEQRSFRLSLRGEYQHDFDSDIEGSDASFSVNTIKANLSGAFQLSEQLTLRGGFEYAFDEYSFDQADTLVPGVASNNPFDPFRTLILTGGADLRLNRQWSLSGTGFVRYEGEGGTDVEDALIGGGLGFFTYSFNKDLTLGFGIGATSRLEDDPWIIPYLFVRWQIDEEWLLRSDGLGARLSWTPAPEYSVFLRGRFVRDEWRLEDDRGAASEGVFRDDRVPVGLGVDWKPIPSLTVTGEVSVMVYRELEFLNDTGGSVSKEKIDGVMPAVGVRVEWRF